MEHPLIGNIDHLSIDELSAQISDLHTKLSIAQRSGKSQVANQIRMAIETFQSKYRQRLEEEYARHTKGANFDDKIKIK